MLEQFGVPGLKISINRRGFRPEGNGEIYVNFPIVNKQLSPCHLKAEGLVKRIRGTACASKCAVSILNRMISSAREILNDYIPDVWIYSEFTQGKNSAQSSGYSISLSAETLTNKRITTDLSMSLKSTKQENLPEELGKRVGLQLIDEIMYSGAVDTTFQSYVLSLMAFSEKTPSVVKLGRITEYTIENLRLIQAFTGVAFKIQDIEEKQLQAEDGADENQSDSDDMDQEDLFGNNNPDMDKGDHVKPKCVLFTCLGVGLINRSREMK